MIDSRLAVNDFWLPVKNNGHDIHFIKHEIKKLYLLISCKFNEIYEVVLNLHYF